MNSESFSPVRESKETDKLYTALAKLRKKISNPQKGSENPQFKSKYADLADVISHVQGPMSECDLFFIQGEWVNGDQPMTFTRICHSSGQWQETDVSLLITSRRTDKDGGMVFGMQDLGSALTYSKRYGLCSALGITGDDDDDGNAAQRSVASRKSKMERTKEQLGLTSASDLPAPKKKQKHESEGMLEAFASLGANAMTQKQVEQVLGVKITKHLTDSQHESLSRLYIDLKGGTFSRAELLSNVGEKEEGADQPEMFGSDPT